jgi:hypothetical protein
MKKYYPPMVSRIHSMLSQAYGYTNSDSCDPTGHSARLTCASTGSTAETGGCYVGTLAGGYCGAGGTPGKSIIAILREPPR